MKNPPSPSRTDQLRPPHHLTYVLKADLILDGVANPATDEERDPPTVRHAQRPKYWSEWLATMHEELEALKVRTQKEYFEKSTAELPYLRLYDK